MDNKSKQERDKKTVVENLEKKARDFHHLFTSPVGVKVLKSLEEEFDPDVLLGETDAKTNYKVGGRDVVVYIRQMIRYKENARKQRELERQSTS